MSKMSELDAVIKDLHTAAATINDVADTLAEMFGNATAEASVTSAELVLTLEAVRAILADKSRRGYTAQIRLLLQKHGADKLSEIDPKEYKALLAEVEVL